MNVVVIDSGQLPAGTDFPLLDPERFGWEEYPRLGGEALAERCWQADVIVSVNTPLPAEALGGLARLKLVVTGDNPVELVDIHQAAARQLTLIHAAQDADLASQAGASVFCSQAVNAIQAFFKHQQTLG